MSMLSIGLLLTAVTASQPLNPRAWATPGDYPRTALRQSRGGYVGFRIAVSSEGDPTRCEVTYKSGHDDLDALTCQLIMRRARFSPAQDADGKKSLSVFRSTITWWVEGITQMNPKPPSSDLDLLVLRLPKDIPDPATATVAFAVDSTGAIANCTPILPQPASAAGSRAADAELRVVNSLGLTACKQVNAYLKPQPETDAQGNAIATIQTAKVLFFTDPAPRRRGQIGLA